MNYLVATRRRRFAWSLLTFMIVLYIKVAPALEADASASRILTNGEIMTRLIALPSLAAFAMMAVLTACTHQSPLTNTTSAAIPAGPAQPFMAQVVGVQWLNPLQRRDYPAEWQLLWTLGLVGPNKDDDMVRTNPEIFSKLRIVSAIAAGNDGEETFKGYHHKYLDTLLVSFYDIYFSSSRYFYNAHSLKDKSTRRELSGIHIEYALPQGRLDLIEATDYTRDRIRRTFLIGNKEFTTAWTHDRPADVHITMGGANAGFTSLSAALDYLQSHPNETVWAMNWDAPSRPKDKQLNENMVLLVLAGPDYKTERDALAWIGYPATSAIADFEVKKDLPPRTMQAWKATLNKASHNASKQNLDIGYVIYDANNTHANSADRIGNLAQILTKEVGELDFMKQSFNTPALLGDMGAGTALTNVALGIVYANHFGKNVLVAGTTDPERTTAVMVLPPAQVRPINPDEPWFRARGEDNAYLMWWGIRHDEKYRMQGYSK